MDEVVLTALRDSWQKLEALEKRRTAVLSALTEREQLTDALEKSIKEAICFALFSEEDASCSTQSVFSFSYRSLPGW